MARKSALVDGKLPDLEVAGTKVGSRKMKNFAKKLAAAEDRNALRDLQPQRFPLFEHVVVHLLEHGALEPVGPAAKLVLETARSSQLSTERLVPVMRAIEADVAAQLPEQMLGWAANAVNRTPDALREAEGELCEPLRGAVAVARSRKEELAGEDRARALDAFLRPLVYGRPPRVPETRGAVLGLAVVPEARLKGELERIGGPDWVTRCAPHPLWCMGFPLPLLLEALRGRPFADRLRVLGSGSRDRAILEAADEPPSVFFAAMAENPRKAPLRLVGMAKATDPSEIPEGIEDDVASEAIIDELGVRALNALGAERLGAWATGCEPERLRELWLRGVELAGPSLERVLAPGPFESAGQVEQWARDEPAHGPPGVLAKRLPAVIDAAHAAEGLTARALRRWAAAIAAKLPEGAEVPTDLDALLEPGQLPHVSHYEATAGALEKLPPERAEAVLVAAGPLFDEAPNDHETTGPERELCFFCTGLSDDYVERVARLIVAHREDELLWSKLTSRRRAYRQEAPRLGAALARALAGQSVPESFMEEIGHAIDEEAEALVRARAGSTESPAAELDRLADAAAGPKVPIYLLEPTEERASQGTPAYTGGRPAGFSEQDVPHADGHPLVHAFTLRLETVPELAHRYPDAATLSLFVEYVTEEPIRAQAWIPRSASELATAPGDLTDARAVEIRKLEVPAALFDDPDEQETSLAKLRNLVYGSAGYLLGGPLWLQDGPAGVDEAFVAQFDERLAEVNLGDTGVAYSYVEECTWQCH